MLCINFVVRGMARFQFLSGNSPLKPKIVIGGIMGSGQKEQSMQMEFKFITTAPVEISRRL